MKKLVWTALVAVTSAAAAALAIRGLRYGWTKILNEQPPEQPWWARKLVGGPLKKGVKGGIEPAANP
jgi:hypothetical protein